MDGLLIVDKPSGPTSHDIVARVRRVLHERRVGHTGTLDPMASGVLPLVVGRATRLARFLSGDKAYIATVRLGRTTDTYDALGRPTGTAFDGPWPSSKEIDAALARFRGTFEQQPPAYSAKKIAGRRSYAIARRSAAVAGPDEPPDDQPRSFPAPVRVTAHAIDLMDVAGDLVTLRVRCSAGFYVRSLAFDLGSLLGTGAHLAALQRVEACGATLDQAISLDRIQSEGGREATESALIPMERMLWTLPSVALNEAGVAHVRFGRNLGPADASAGFVEAVSESGSPAGRPIRLLDPAGQLVAVAEAADVPGLLHAAVVLV